MGLDLKLLPMTFIGDDWAHSYTMLPVLRCSALYDALKALPSLQVPSRFNTYLERDPDPEETSGNTQEDRLGDPIRYVLVRDLLPLATHEGVVRYGNESTWAYLAHLLPNSKVALFWE